MSIQHLVGKRTQTNPQTITGCFELHFKHRGLEAGLKYALPLSGSKQTDRLLKNNCGVSYTKQLTAYKVLPLTKELPQKVFAASNSCNQKHSLKLRSTACIWLFLGICREREGRRERETLESNARFSSPPLFFFAVQPCLHSLFRSHRYAKHCLDTSIFNAFPSSSLA